MAPHKKASAGASSSRQDKGKRPRVAEEVVEPDVSLLRNPSLLTHYKTKQLLTIQPGRFIKFPDFASLHLQEILGTLAPALDSSNTLHFYPDLICQFFTNLVFDRNAITISTMVCSKSFTF